MLGSCATPTRCLIPPTVPPYRPQDEGCDCEPIERHGYGRMWTLLRTEIVKTGTVIQRVGLASH
eukprot:4304612-Pyramimonas_sp.AAC.1